MILFEEERLHLLSSGGALLLIDCGALLVVGGLALPVSSVM